MGHDYANYFSKTYIVCYRKVPKKKKIAVSVPGKTPVKLKNAPNRSNNFHPVPAQAQPTLILLLLARYCGSTTMCRRNGNPVDPNQTDFWGAG